MFDEKSRYARTEQYHLHDRRGRLVAVVAVPEAVNQALLGYHLHKDGQRTDHLAAHYLDNAAGFWRINEMNNSVLPDSLSEKNEISIPVKTL